MFATVPFRIRNSVRAFAHTPAIALALVVTIAIGVGSSASVAGFIGGLAHPRLPVGASDQIVSIVAHDRFSDAGPLSESEYEAIRGRSDVFGWVDAVRIVPFEVAINGHSEMLTIAAVMPDLAKTLNLNLKGGAVLSDHLWETEFNGESGEVSRVARVGNAQFEITGVAAKSL